jgi:glutaminase
MQALLNEILDAVRPLIGQGKVANYIPALGTVAANQLGIAVYSNDGEMYCAGDAETAFSVQSISKVFSLVQAIGHSGEAIWERLGHEPSGHSTPWCNWSSNGAVRATHSSMPEPW